MDSRFRPHRFPPARGTIKYGRASTLASTRALRLRHSPRRRTADGVLAGVFELARQVFAGSRSRPPVGAAPDRAGVLRSIGDGPPRPPRKNVANIFRPRLG